MCVSDHSFFWNVYSDTRSDFLSDFPMGAELQTTHWVVHVFLDMFDLN